MIDAEPLFPIPLQVYEHLAHELGMPGMLDVARMHLGQACPRCSGRRVYAVEQDKNLWLCIPNAMPVPWRRDQVIEHDAAEFTQDPQVNE